MDNIPSLQIGFDGHYVVCLWETGGEIPPVHPTRENGLKIPAEANNLIKINISYRYHDNPDH